MCAEQLTAVDLLAAAVVFDWDGTAVADRHRSARQVRRRIESLCERGIHVAVVSGAQVDNIDRQFGARPSGPGRLLLALNRGSELYDVSACGPRLLLRRDETSAVGRQLDEAADRVVAELGARGLEVALR